MNRPNAWTVYACGKAFYIYIYITRGNSQFSPKDITQEDYLAPRRIMVCAFGDRCAIPNCNKHSPRRHLDAAAPAYKPSKAPVPKKAPGDPYYDCLELYLEQQAWWRSTPATNAAA